VNELTYTTPAHRRPNVAELDRVVTFIEDHPEQHNQSLWIRPDPRDNASEPWHCGTVGCLAGWTVLLNGWALVPDDDELVQRGNREESVENVAEEILGLNHNQSYVLFHQAQNVDELRLLTDALKSDPHADIEVIMDNLEYYENYDD